MAPIIEVSDRVLKGLNQLGVEYRPYEPSQESVKASESKSNFIYVPSLNLDISSERSYYGLTWSQSHRALADERARMLTMPEFREFLIYTRENRPEVYENITAVRSPWRAEWIDTAFEKRQDGLYVLTGNRTKAEKLDEDTLMKDKTPGISLDSWLSDEATAQGFPSKGVGNGNSWYWHPRDGAVAWFFAYSDWSFLYCDGFPAGRYPVLGVRAAKPRE